MKKHVYPINAPGMPLPGIDFITLANNLGDPVALRGKGKNITLEHADFANSRLQRLIRKALYSAGDFSFPMTIKNGRVAPMTIITGHRWGSPKATGPEPCEVMIIGKMLGEEEGRACRHMCGPTGKLLMDTLQQLGVPQKEMARWYVTNVLKCESPDPNSATFAASWVKEFAHLLHQELRIVRPRVILCLGADAVKTVLGKDFSVAKLEGRSEKLRYCINEDLPHTEDADSLPQLTYHEATVMACVHPASVLRSPEQQPQLEFSLKQFINVARGEELVEEETGLDHRIVDDLETLLDLVEEIRNDPDSYVTGPDGVERAVIAVDAEWNGEHPQNKNSYVRTIQVSWAHKKAACIVLTAQGGEPCFEGGTEAAIEQLRRICCSDDEREVRIVGHFLVADMEWLLPLGLDIRPDFMAPPTWQEAVYKGGFDTGLAYHAVNETGDFSLKGLALRFTTAGRYDIALQKWIKEFCKMRQGLIITAEGEPIKEDSLEGFGECPSDILYPYALLDADVTRRLFFIFSELLSCDQHGNCSWEPFWINMRCTPAVLEMHQHGLYVNRARIDELTTCYMKSRENLREELRNYANWNSEDPNDKNGQFNIGSPHHVREFLFGEEFNGKKRASYDAPPTRIRPKGAKSLKLYPIMSTGKRPQRWDEVVANGAESETTPSTNKMALAILAEESQKVPVRSKKTGKVIFKDYSKPVLMIRNQRFIDQVLKSILRPPVKRMELVYESKTGKPLKKPRRVITEDVIERDGHFVYAGGLPAAICADGRVRTHLYQTKETGRWSSARPPLQNFPKRREDDHKRILGDWYTRPLRSILGATPGRVLIEADFIGAELYGMAMMAGDDVMIDHCLRNQLKEDDPNYYDIHSNIAVFAFRLEVEPTKKALKAIGRAGLRIVAKSVIFGIAYGRGAKAIALAAKEEGVNVTEEEAQQVIDAVFAMYPRLKPFFAEAQARAITEGWLCNAFGRMRRFPKIPGVELLTDFRARLAKGALRSGEREPRLSSASRQAIGDAERQAMNFPIQSMIADAMSRAIDHLYHYRFRYTRDELWYDLVLQIHDAVIIECDPKFVPRIVDEVLPYCMHDSVPIYPCTLDGVWNEKGPYHLGIDIELCTEWGVAPLPGELYKLGVDPIAYGHWKTVDKFRTGADEYVSGLVNDNYPGKVWLPDHGMVKAYTEPKIAV